MGNEAALRAPPMGDRGPTVGRPLPIGAAIELVRQPTQLHLLFRVAVEVGGASEHSGKQEGGIDSGKFAVPDAPSGLDVKKVIVEASVSRRVHLRTLRAIPEEAQSLKRELGSELAGNHTAFDEHRNSGQRQT